MRRRLGGRRADGDDGNTLVLAVILSTAVLLLIGLLFDGGRVFEARRTADNLARQAARAAAQHVDLDSVRDPGREPQLLEGDALDAAYVFLDGQGVPPADASVTVAGMEVWVTVTKVQETPLLAVAGMPSRTVVASQYARGHIGSLGAS